MTEVLFYHLQGQKLEGVLTPLLEKSLERGWKVIVQGTSEERIEALDAHLWTYREDGFLPHGTWREPEAAAQPVLLTLNDTNPNAATVRFLIEGADLPADAEAYARIVLVFNGDDDDAVAAARVHWAAAKAKGFEATYWQLDEQGRWVKKAWSRGWWRGEVGHWPSPPLACIGHRPTEKPRSRSQAVRPCLVPLSMTQNRS